MHNRYIIISKKVINLVYHIIDMKKLLLFLICSGIALACSCIEPGSPMKELEKSSAVFSGRVTGIDDCNRMTDYLCGYYVTFQVYEVWKGDIAEETTVITSDNSASCGFNFEQGKEYIIYADGDELSVSLCSRTRLLSLEDTELLGESSRPLKSINSFPWTGLFLAMIVVGGLIYWKVK